jgi:hypothetical protein
MLAPLAHEASCSTGGRSLRRQVDRDHSRIVPRWGRAQPESPTRLREPPRRPGTVRNRR